MLYTTGFGSYVVNLGNNNLQFIMFLRLLLLLTQKLVIQQTAPDESVRSLVGSFAVGSVVVCVIVVSAVVGGLDAVEVGP